MYNIGNKFISFLLTLNHIKTDLLTDGLARNNRHNFNGISNGLFGPVFLPANQISQMR